MEPVDRSGRVPVEVFDRPVESNLAPSTLESLVVLKEASINGLWM